MVSQTIAGALEMYCLPIDLLAPKNVACGIFGVGFAFDGYKHCWEAMDGDLGNYLRDIASQIGFHCMEKCPDHGFRQITMKSKPINTPDDLKGVKLRLPVAPYLIALFQHLGASPTPINFGEVYSALQTGLVDGQENPLILIDTAKLYEVQKYCSMTSNVWAGIHIPSASRIGNNCRPIFSSFRRSTSMPPRWSNLTAQQKMTDNETKKTSQPRVWCSTRPTSSRFRTC